MLPLVRRSTGLGLTLALLLFACLKGGTTGTQTTDDTGSAGGTGSSKQTKSDGDGGFVDVGTDDTGTTGTSSGTDDTGTHATNDGGKSEVAGNPGDPCTLGSECLSGICPKTTKTCDGCYGSGSTCTSNGRCCAQKEIFGSPLDRTCHGTCGYAKTVFPGDACTPGRDLCSGGYCSIATCLAFCTSNADCKDPKNPLCSTYLVEGSGKKTCGYHDCTTDAECAAVPNGHVCLKSSKNPNLVPNCGCKVDGDCPSGTHCNISRCQ